MKLLSAVFAALALLASGGAHGTPPARGLSWRAPQIVAAGGGERGPWRQNESRYDYVDDPTVALDARGTAAVAWVDQRLKDVLVQAFDAEGRAQLAAPSNVSRSPATFSWLPRMARSAKAPNDLYVLWQEIVFSGGSHGGEIFFARSGDGGRTFAPPLNLSNSTAGDGKGRITVDYWHNGSLDLVVTPDGVICAAWTEYDGPLWVSRSQDGGASFSRPLLVWGGGRARPARAPALAAGPDGAIHLAWTTGEDRGADIRVARSADGGRTFAAPVVVERTRTYSDAPKIAADARGTVHVAYAESSGGPFDGHHIRYARARHGGLSFERSRAVSLPHPTGVSSAAYPHLALGGRGEVYVLWELYAAARARPYGLGYAQSVDAGDTFTAPAVVPGSRDPDGGANGGNQGLLMRKLAVNAQGAVAVVNSSFEPGVASRVWLIRGEYADPMRGAQSRSRLGAALRLASAEAERRAAAAAAPPPRAW